MTETDDGKNAELLRLLGHPVRLKILRLLLRKPSCATLTNREIGISQPNLSQHLKVLKEAGILDFRSTGTKRCYYVARPEFVKNLFKLFADTEKRTALKEKDLRKLNGSEHEH
jgi:ArsR family transcriptional regulator